MAVTVENEKALGGLVIGVDEAGRGPLAGGVFAAAVHVPFDLADQLLVDSWKGIDDSKKLAEHRRTMLAEVIKNTEGCVWAVACASPAEIDRLNILKATHLAMARAVGEVRDALLRGGAAADDIRALVDGLPVTSLPCASANLVKGDAKSLMIAAASILAKTTRDKDCERLEAMYPGYGFARHKGYPTVAHLKALAALGPCPEHRMSFGPVAQMELGI